MTKTKQLKLWKCRNCGKELLTDDKAPENCNSFGCQFNMNPVFIFQKEFTWLIEE